MMKDTNYRRLLTHARLLHTDLRDCRRTPETAAERLALCEAVRRKLEIVSRAVEATGKAKPELAIFQPIQELILDATHHAGATEKGFLQPDGVEDRYDLLLEALKDRVALADDIID